MLNSLLATPRANKAQNYCLYYRLFICSPVVVFTPAEDFSSTSTAHVFFTSAGIEWIPTDSGTQPSFVFVLVCVFAYSRVCL